MDELIALMDVRNLWRDRTYILETLDAADSGKPIVGYLSDGCEHVTSWMGTRLGRVTSVHRMPDVVTPTGGRAPMVAVRARIGGRTYYGRGQGSGMYIRLRAAKR